MNIQGDNVILRSISMKDTDLLINMINDPETEKMLGGWSFPVSIDEQKNWITAQNGRTDVLRCIIALKENEDIGLGTIILNDIDLKNGVAQVHIKMDKQQGRGKGYGTDALNALVNYSFNEMRINCIYANILEYNIVSQKLFEKCGFLREGVLRNRVFKCGSYINIISYSKLKEEPKC